MLKAVFLEEVTVIKRLLIVEDDIHGQEITRRLLEHNHFVVDVAADGEQALALLHKYVYSGVIIDLSLPGMSGWELLHTIRAQENGRPTQYWHKLPCFAVTAYHSRDVERKAQEHGFTKYYSKPIDLSSFVTDLKLRIP